VDCGTRPAKAVTGETFEVSATVFREGHGLIGVGAVLRDPDRRPSPVVPMRELAPGTDRYGADLTVTEEGLWRFHVEAWADPIASGHHDATIKIPAGQDVELMLTEGALQFERVARRIPQPPGARAPAVARTALRAASRSSTTSTLNPCSSSAVTVACSASSSGSVVKRSGMAVVLICWSSFLQITSGKSWFPGS